MRAESLRQCDAFLKRQLGQFGAVGSDEKVLVHKIRPVTEPFSSTCEYQSGARAPALIWLEINLRARK